MRSVSVVAARSTLPVGALLVETGLRTDVRVAADRASCRPSLSTGEQGFAPIFVSFVETVASDPRVDHVADGLVHDHWPLPLTLVFEWSIGIRTVTEIDEVENIDG